MRLRTRLAAVTLLILTCAGVILFGLPATSRAGPESLQVEAAVAAREDGLLELRLSWSWNLPSRFSWRTQEELLAVDFDTRELLFEAEEATYGVGANGENLNLLERVAGLHGARRLFVVPEGRDGEARLILRPTGQMVTRGGLIRVHTVVDPALGPGAIHEMQVSAWPGAGGHAGNYPALSEM